MAISPARLSRLPSWRSKNSCRRSVIEHGMSKMISKNCAAGVKILGEVGLGSVKDGKTARQMVAWARNTASKARFTWRPIYPRLHLIDKDMCLRPTPMLSATSMAPHGASDDQITALCEHSSRALELCTTERARRLLALRTAMELKQLKRVILGTDSPAGSGVQPLGILRMIGLLSRSETFPQSLPFAWLPVTRPIAPTRLWTDCDGPRSVICSDGQSPVLGREEPARQHSKGDLPGIGMVIIDGAVSVQRSRNTPHRPRCPKL